MNDFIHYKTSNDNKLRDNKLITQNKQFNLRLNKNRTPKVGQKGLSKICIICSV